MTWPGPNTDNNLFSSFLQFCKRFSFVFQYESTVILLFSPICMKVFKVNQHVPALFQKNTIKTRSSPMRTFKKYKMTHFEEENLTNNLVINFDGHRTKVPDNRVYLKYVELSRIFKTNYGIFKKNSSSFSGAKFPDGHRTHRFYLFFPSTFFIAINKFLYCWGLVLNNSCRICFPRLQVPLEW